MVIAGLIPFSLAWVNMHFCLWLCGIHAVNPFDHVRPLTVDFSSRALIAIVATPVGFSPAFARDSYFRLCRHKVQERNDFHCYVCTGVCGDLAWRKTGLSSTFEAFWRTEKSCALPSGFVRAGEFLRYTLYWLIHSFHTYWGAGGVRLRYQKVRISNSVCSSP